jgi:hypothetical protein
MGHIIPDEVLSTLHAAPIEFVRPAADRIDILLAIPKYQGMSLDDLRTAVKAKYRGIAVFDRVAAISILES